MASKRKPQKQHFLLRAGLATVRNLAAPKVARRVCEAFEAGSPELAPAHVVNGRSRQAISVGDLESILSKSAGPVGLIDLVLSGQVRGSVEVACGRGPGTPSHRIVLTCDFPRIMARSLFDDFRKLFARLCEAIDAQYAYMQIQAEFRYMLADEPTELIPVFWNGVEIHLMGWPQLHLYCLPGLYPWITVLGPAWVNVIGQDKLAALDVFEKRFDSGGRFWLQMTERPEQAHLPETIEHMKRLEASLEMPDIWCPANSPGGRDGWSKFRAPQFDRSEIRVPVVGGVGLHRRP